MTRARCTIPIEGGVVITSEATGKRYVFTRRKTELEIDDCDVEQFRRKEITTSPCGCTGGQGTKNKTIKVFEIVE